LTSPSLTSLGICRISIFSSNLPALADSRSLLIIPPNTAGIENPNPIQVIQLDETASVVPRGMGLVVVHLTSVWDGGGGGVGECDGAVLGRAVEFIKADGGAEELHHICFSFAIDGDGDGDGDGNGNGDGDADDSYRTSSNNVFVVNRRKELFNVTVDEAFREAKRIFEKACPGETILGRGRFGGEEEEEEDVEDSVLQDLARRG